MNKRRETDISGIMNIAFFIAIAVIAGLCNRVDAQSPPLVNNNGAIISIKPGATVIVKTNSAKNWAGTVSNGGTLIIEDDFINNATADGGGTSGLYRIGRNWENNGQFIPDSSEVKLYGAAQLITGTSVTSFYDLTLEGTDIKRQTIDAKVIDKLELNDRELATDSNNMYVLNTDTGAIHRSTGFVSSLDTGGLARNTNSSSAYFFPVGSSLGTPRFRPVVITPQTALLHTFKVRFANRDATLEGYDRNNKAENICEINPDFYHRINRITGSDPADITLFFDPSQDGPWTIMAHYQHNPRWEDMGTYSKGNSGLFTTYTKTGWTNYTYSPFALGTELLTVDAGNNDTIALGTNTQLGSNVNNGTGNIDYHWFPESSLDNPYSDSPVATPDVTTSYILEVTDDFGCKNRDTVVIKVLNTSYNFPNAFTPDGDGINDYFHIINQGGLVTLDELKIYNRWGEQVHNSTDPWDGKYKGEMQPMDNYIYKAVVKLPDGTLKSEIGDFTLIR